MTGGSNNLQLVQDRAESSTVRGSQQKGPTSNLEGMMLIMGIINYNRYSIFIPQSITSTMNRKAPDLHCLCRSFAQGDWLTFKATHFTA